MSVCYDQIVNVSKFSYNKKYTVNQFYSFVLYKIFQLRVICKTKIRNVFIYIFLRFSSNLK